MQRADILDLSLAEIQAWFEELGAPRFRAAQVASWLYRHGAREFAEMSNLPRPLRERLAASFRIGSLALAGSSQSEDGTRKLLLRLADDASIESVLIPDGARLTLCVSTQVGCAMGCAFCATAKLGLRRNLTRGEIVGQLLLAQALLAEPAAGAHADGCVGPPERITNLVFMGMGEPLHNYAATVGAIETLTAPWGVDFSHRRITVSTVGLVAQMQRLLADTQVNLAVSLTAVDQEVRRQLMPVAKRHPVDELLAACRALALPRRKRITFEYVLLAGVNDGVEHARELARALSGIRCKVNLIPFNRFPGSVYERSGDLATARFQDVLRRARVHATIRESRGSDVAAACGQLVAEERGRLRAATSVAPDEGRSRRRTPDAAAGGSRGGPPGRRAQGGASGARTRAVS